MVYFRDRCRSRLEIPRFAYERSHPKNGLILCKYSNILLLMHVRLFLISHLLFDAVTFEGHPIRAINRVAAQFQPNFVSCSKMGDDLSRVWEIEMLNRFLRRFGDAKQSIPII